MELEGDANDYIGKGLSGGKIVVYPPHGSQFAPEENIIIGNVALYGATTGEAYFNGVAGERFAVRNSGATAVVEGLGDHGCEYMTRGADRRPWQMRTQLRRRHERWSGVRVRREGRFRREAVCNMASVDLERIAEDDPDAGLLFAVISRHVAATQSPLGRRILDNWEQMLPRFLRIFPHEYRRALAAGEKVGHAIDLTIPAAPPAVAAQVAGD